MAFLSIITRVPVRTLLKWRYVSRYFNWFIDLIDSINFIWFDYTWEMSGILLHFAWVIDDAKCIVVTRVCVSVCLSTAACPHYCTDPDVTWGIDRGCPLVVHYWADLQSVHGLSCYGNMTQMRNVSEYMLVLALCLVCYVRGKDCPVWMLCSW